MKKHKLRKPVVFENVTYAEIEYDLDALTARDILNVQGQVKASGRDLGMSLLVDEISLAAAVAYAAGQPVAFVLELSAVDYIALVTEAQGFFGAGLVDSGDGSTTSSE